MRPVMVIHWTTSAINPRQRVKQDLGPAMFHQWGVDYEEFEAGTGNYSTAIIEWADGTVENVRADMIRFTDKEGV